jgi:DMSO/TMAO reductase YedYZ molybdopterin-dependent catalytic subunit
LLESPLFDEVIAKTKGTIMKLERRSFIRLIPLGLAVALAGWSWWFFGQPSRAPTTASRTAVKPSEASQTAIATSEASQTSATASKAFDFPVTWNADETTEVNPKDYRLTIDGDVSKPLEFTIEELYAMSDIQRTVKIECVDGWAADVLWQGVPLSHLLSLAGAPEKIAYVTIQSLTGYKTTLSSELKEISNPDNIIALKARGIPLTAEHGFPARLVAPTKWGMGWVKYVRRITCTSE